MSVNQVSTSPGQSIGPTIDGPAVPFDLAALVPEFAPAEGADAPLLEPVGQNPDSEPTTELVEQAIVQDLAVEIELLPPPVESGKDLPPPGNPAAGQDRLLLVQQREEGAANQRSNPVATPIPETAPELTTETARVEERLGIPAMPLPDADAMPVSELAGDKVEAMGDQLPTPEAAAFARGFSPEFRAIPSGPAGTAILHPSANPGVVPLPTNGPPPADILIEAGANGAAIEGVRIETTSPRLNEALSNALPMFTQYLGDQGLPVGPIIVAQTDRGVPRPSWDFGTSRRSLPMSVNHRFPHPDRRMRFTAYA